MHIERDLMKAVQFGCAAALALLALAPGVGAAQDGRTVEGAQKFLALHTGPGGIRAIVWGAEDPTTSEFLDDADVIEPRHAEPVGRCATKFTRASDSVVIDWSEVNEVRGEDEGILIWGGVDGGDNADVNVQSDEMHNRVAAAMKFLHAQCNPSSLTGF